MTGGASGLGRGTAERLVAQGARVVLADLPGSKGDIVAAEIGGTEQVIFSPTDVPLLLPCPGLPWARPVGRAGF